MTASQVAGMSVALALGIEEGLLHHARRGALAAVLDGDFHLQRRARHGPAGLEMREGDVLLEDRRPAAARGVARLLAPGVERDARAPRLARQSRGEPDLGVETLQGIPVHLDADELPLRAALLF